METTLNCTLYTVLWKTYDCVTVFVLHVMINKTYYKYESELCNKYQEMIGHYPLLSSNSGVE